MERPSSTPAIPTTGMPGVSELIKDSIEIVKKRPGFFFSIAAVPAILYFIGQLIVAINPFLFLWFIPFLLLGMIAGVFAGIATIKGLADDKMSDWKQAYSESTKLFWPLIWSAILVTVVVFIGLILLVIPGLYLSIVFSFYMFALILDNARGWNAAEKSKQLVKGYWWSVFGRLIALGLILTVIMGILSIVIGMTGSNVAYAVFNLIITIVITPFGAAYSYLMYKSLQDIKGKSGNSSQPEQPAVMPTA